MNGCLCFCFTVLVDDEKRGFYAYLSACQIVFNEISHYSGEKCTHQKAQQRQLKKKKKIRKKFTKTTNETLKKTQKTNRK